MSNPSNTTERPPVVAIMGHVDHGKSTLLDYIRKTNVVAGEAGGITQHLSAYEVTHKDEAGTDKRITFIDTPGHAAFSGMRTRGATVADIAILIVSAEEGVKTQTAEAITTIKENNVPFVVAINKIDRPNANPEKVKSGLMEHGVFLEGYGGDVSFAEISAKEGTGVSELLDLILLTAALEEFTGDTDKPAEGFVIEANRDTQRGITATLIIKDGSIKQGDFVVAGQSIASTRILEDFTGKSITEARFSTPIRVTGFNNIPEAGSLFMAYHDKKSAEATASAALLLLKDENEARTRVDDNEQRHIVPIIIKTDVSGTKEAVEAEINKLSTDKVLLKIIRSEVGDINENDIKLGMTAEGAFIIGFNVSVDKQAKELNEQTGLQLQTFSIIYKLTEWLTEAIESARPRHEVEIEQGSAVVLKIFSNQKDGILLGGRIIDGEIRIKDTVRIERADQIMGYGVIETMQQAKMAREKVLDGEFGLMLKSKIEVEEKDTLIAIRKEIQ